MVPCQEIKIATKEFEKRFSKVQRAPEPDSETISLGGLKTMPKMDSIPVLGFTTETISFVRITSGEDAEGFPLLFPTGADAAHAWLVNANAFVDGSPKLKDLYWRVEPEIDFVTDFERSVSGYYAYSRLGAH